MGLTISNLFNRLFGKKQMRILMGEFYFLSYVLMPFLGLLLLLLNYCSYLVDYFVAIRGQYCENKVIIVVIFRFSALNAVILPTPFLLQLMTTLRA